MIKSMTGFGRADVRSAVGSIRVEAKSVNHKFFELSLRLPPHLADYEDALRKLVAQDIRRGKINLFVSSPDPATASSRLVLNEPLAREVHQKVKRLKKILHVSGGDDKTLEIVMQYPNVLMRETSAQKGGLVWKQVTRALSLAIESLNSSRLREGKALEKDLRKRLGEMHVSLGVIKKRIPLVARAYKRILEKKMNEFLPAEGGSASGGKDQDIYYERIVIEVAQYAKNSDISEEVTRLASHIDAMTAALSEKGELGRKIDFIAQEMNREANTMGAKSNDSVLSNSVIHIKSTIEKIREQAQNVE